MKAVSILGVRRATSARVNGKIECLKHNEPFSTSDGDRTVLCAVAVSALVVF